MAYNGAGGKKVYDVTKYLNDHPGGPEIILDLAGMLYYVVSTLLMQFSLSWISGFITLTSNFPNTTCQSFRRTTTDLRFVVLGKDADEMFEDIGHSSEARSKMKEYLIGTLKVHINPHIHFRTS